MMNVPADLRYSKDHEWLRIEGDFATIGITDFAQGELGDIVFVDIPTEGETMDAEEVFGSVEAVKTCTCQSEVRLWKSIQIWMAHRKP